jgi:hypothetical protein
MICYFPLIYIFSFATFCVIFFVEFFTYIVSNITIASYSQFYILRKIKQILTHFPYLLNHVQFKTVSLHIRVSMNFKTT